MLRTFILYLSQANLARRIVTDLPIARRAAGRFVAGNTLDEALETVQRLNQEGLSVTLDHVGENVSNLDESQKATDDYLDLITRLQAAEIRGNASVKLTQLGINLSQETCLTNIRRIVDRAQKSGMMIRIDMEDSPVVDQTLATWKCLIEEGRPNVGLVLQAYLY